MISLGNQHGEILATSMTNSTGAVSFERDGLTMTATILKATEPDVPLVGAIVHLVRRVDDAGNALAEYVLMVDDEYWGRRIQPAEFQAQSFSEIIVMGYRLKGQILENGIAKADANVSLEVTLADRDGNEATMWDSLEYNGLVYDAEQDTYVEGAIVYAPLRTNVLGEFEFIAPKGHGAIYQRADDYRDGTAETAADGLPRYVQTVKAVYLGRKVELVEEQVGIIDILSGTLEVTGTPGAMLRIGTLDDAGQTYTVPSGGVVTVAGLPAGEHCIVQFRRNGWGEWDASWECPRMTVDVKPGETTSVTMAPMVYHDMAGNVACGRVYKRMGVPAAGIDIVLMDWESCEMLGTVATTDAGGYWEITIPDEGLGGDLWVHDANWGSVPLMGYPYSDVVLGARVYSSFTEYFRPEAWRKEDRGHKNFPYVQDAIVVKNSSSGAEYATEEAAYGGWQTVEALPAYEYEADVETLLINGPQKQQYDIVDGETVLEAGFTLSEQSFETGETLPGHFRAAGHYPEATFLLGGKIAGNVVLPAESTAPQGHIGAELPEALRAGLEFGEHCAYVEMRANSEITNPMACVADFTCPYCGGPAHRDPSTSNYKRGHCIQCANAFGVANAMDCRTSFVTPTLATDALYSLLADIIQPDGTELSCETTWHWRPDLYAETSDFLSQTGPAQVTNAPRWVAKHVDELGDGKGFGNFDATATPAFTPGHDVEYFEALPEIQRTLGLAQMKIIFPAGYTLPEKVGLQVTCVREDWTSEDVTVTLAAGLHGPTAEDPLGDVVLLVPAEKLQAEQMTSPYDGLGLYRGVSAVEVTSPPPPDNCKFSIVNDNPWLASTAGIPVKRAMRTPACLQLMFPGGGVELIDDAVGQIYLFYGCRGDVWMTRRPGLGGIWETVKRITQDGGSSEPTAEKDDAGTLVLFRQQGTQSTRKKTREDGRDWEL